MAPDKQKDELDEQGGAAHLPTADERAALSLLSYDQALQALEAEDPVAVAVATEYIQSYSEKLGQLLKDGKDYLELLAPSPELPAIERIAMELVLETVEEELDREEP